MKMTNEIKHGDKTIKLTLYFWTDKMEKEGITDPKAAWSIGTVNAKANKSRGISPDKSGVPFNSFSELPDAINKVLTMHGITLHSAKK